jgi:hypothetical protein
VGTGGRRQPTGLHRKKCAPIGEPNWFSGHPLSLYIYMHGFPVGTPYGTEFFRAIPHSTAFTDCLPLQCRHAREKQWTLRRAQSNPGCPGVLGPPVPTLVLAQGTGQSSLPRDACGDRGPPPTYRIAQKKVRSYRRTELVFGTPPVLIYIHARFSGRYSLRNRIFSCNSTFHCFYRLPSIAVPTRQGEAVDATPRAVQPWMSWGSWAPSPDFGPCPRDRPVVLAKGRLWGQGAAANLQDCTEKSALL